MKKILILILCVAILAATTLGLVMIAIAYHTTVIQNFFLTVVGIILLTFVLLIGCEVKQPEKKLLLIVLIILILGASIFGLMALSDTIDASFIQDFFLVIVGILIFSFSLLLGLAVLED
jgi:hypothetical protein